MIGRRYGRHVVLMPVIVGVAAVHLAAQGPGNSLFTDPARRFTVEVPKNWTQMMVAASGEPLAVFVHPNREASVVVEHFTMKWPLANDAVTDVFTQLEIQALNEKQPQATDIISKIETEGGRSRAVIDYSRSVIDRERVRQFSYPAGRDLYRITCMTLSDRFVEYEPLCSMVAASLRLKTEGPGAFARAEAYESAGLFEKAIEWYDRANRLLPDDDPKKGTAKERLDSLRARR